MPVFEFHNRWVNLRFQPVETNTDTASGNDAPSLSKEGRFWTRPCCLATFGYTSHCPSSSPPSPSLGGGGLPTKTTQMPGLIILHRLSGRSRPKAHGDGGFNTIGIRYLISQSSSYRNRARTNGTGTDKTSTDGSTTGVSGGSIKTDRSYWPKLKWPWTWPSLDKKPGSLLPEHESK